MTRPLRILFVEDSQDDAQLLLLHLRERGIVCECEREDTLEGFQAALAAGPWDLVLSDFSLPGTDGLEILKHLRRQDPDLPFILLSGTLDENAAVEAMRSGANDFLLKNNLARLVPAIEREMKEADLRRKQRLFEEELRLLHTAIGQTPDMVVITDPQGVILYANAAAAAITGYRREDLLGQNPRLFKSGMHDATFYQSMWAALLKGETWKGHIVNRRKDGSFWDAEAVIAPVFNAKGEPQNYLCTARDISHERQLQSLLEQSQRLETIGTLTSGIAHDFNNILMPVLGHAELGLARPPGDPRIQHDLEVIHASAERARDLVRQILSFSRKGEEPLAPLEIQPLLSESLKLLRSSLPTSIGFEVQLDAWGACVTGDPTQLHQVILNLCTNAAHAMRGRAGLLTVRLQREHLPPTACAGNILLLEGEYLCLEVTDTGKGIPPENIEKIFLPFFTTKPTREGTGLGLSVTHGIVSSMKGGFQVTSRLGEGTTFRVLLPIADRAELLPDPVEAVPPVGHGHVLLVDDEENLLGMLEASLTRMGFQVSAHRRPEAALEAFRRNPRAFDALVTDHTMPVLSGLQLAEGVWALRPGFPIILLSGDPEVMKGGDLTAGRSGFKAYLAKPISANAIGTAILEAMG